MEIDVVRKELVQDLIIDHTKTAIRVPIIESEKGWGQKIDDYVICIDSEAAKAFIIDYNSKNTESKTPDWYMYASNDISTIEVTRNQFNYIVNHGNTWLNHLKTIK